MELNNVGVARYNEILAKFIILSLRRLVILEELHSIDDDGRVAVNFEDPDWAFEPLPAEYIVPDVDLDDDAAVQDPGDDPPPLTGDSTTAA